ncbi:dihydrodipicolinate synthase family protein [Rhizobium sp. AN80A]|uniref:dihydrodipicolinate synthase family protein n=1 Tax=Rhizobium sp. AN80A TaxID=3040673 RepID=UPI0032C47177
MTQTRIAGVIAALPTPFDHHDDVDRAAFIEHGRWCLNHGCDFLNVLGTTGEANSVSATQRSALMTTAARELDGSRLMVGTGTPDLETTVGLTRRAFDLGFAAALVLPPLLLQTGRRRRLVCLVCRARKDDGGDTDPDLPL